ncbi:Gmad2 immunoglobulin-like domain-containing protein [Evansella sp. AB-rgal1]|uniref:Gmad2 immunoglobulin-like domain-containing protein n=1 Tax=Evansella sp. AB-rgal1 TaxID=3242696 RepID=UPI00359E9C8C
MEMFKKVSLLFVVCTSLLIACNQNTTEDSLQNNESGEQEEPLNENEDHENERTGEGSLDDQDIGSDDREIVLENDAFKIFHPDPNSEVDNLVTVQGLARVYEGTVQYELEDGHFIYASGHTTANSGAPNWGEFEVTIDLSDVPNGSATLFLFEESADDGSRQNELNIPLNVKKDQDSNNDTDIVLENDAIKIFSPAPHAEVENQVIVKGVARVFEGTLQYELEDGHYILASGFTTTSAGAPEWGEFEIVIDIDFVSNQSATIILFEESAKDGSRINELYIPLTVGKDQYDQEEVVVENTAFKIYTPAPYSEVTNQVLVRGAARVFEATFQYEIEDGHNVLASGYSIATDGAPEWGEFEIVIDFDEKEVTNDSLTLILFEGSPKDGSRINELIVPLKVNK